MVVVNVDLGCNILIKMLHGERKPLVLLGKPDFQIDDFYLAKNKNRAKTL